MARTAPHGSHPLNIAAYVTWAAVALGVWIAMDSQPSVGPVPARLAALLLLAIYLAAFAFHTYREDELGPGCHVRIALLAASTLALMLLGPSGTAPVLLIILAAVVTYTYPLPAAVAVLVAVNAAFLAIVLLRWDLRSPLLTVFLLGCFQAFAASTTHALRRSETMAEELRQVNARLLATRSLLAETARESERLRVSRELHDVAGHKLTALKLNLEALGRDGGVVDRPELAVSRQLAAELLEDVRSVVSALRRDDGLDLQEAIARVAEPFPQPRVHVEVAEGARVADAEQGEALLRVAQEGLTNVARHSDARNAWVSLRTADGTLELVVEDDGTHRGVIAPGHGLQGMRERLESLEGSLETGHSGKGGLRLRARLPRRTAR